MKSLPTDLAVELAKEYHHLAHLFAFSFSSTYRYTDADLNIYYNSNWWTTRGISFTSANYSVSPKTESIEFDIDNVDLAISAIVMNEEVRGKPCSIYRVALDNNMAVVGASLIFPGFVDNIEIDNLRARVNVANHFIKWKMLTPRRVHQATCMWTFKGTYCGYSGAGTWCDHSWERCTALSNTAKFGGFKWLPYLADKQVWWGRTPS